MADTPATDIPAEGRVTFDYCVHEAAVVLSDARASTGTQRAAEIENKQRIAETYINLAKIIEMHTPLPNPTLSK